MLLFRIIFIPYNHIQLNYACIVITNSPWLSSAVAKKISFRWHLYTNCFWIWVKILNWSSRKLMFETNQISLNRSSLNMYYVQSKFVRLGLCWRKYTCPRVRVYILPTFPSIPFHSGDYVHSFTPRKFLHNMANKWFSQQKHLLNIQSTCFNYNEKAEIKKTKWNYVSSNLSIDNTRVRVGHLSTILIIPFVIR